MHSSSGTVKIFYVIYCCASYKFFSFQLCIAAALRSAKSIERRV